MLQQPNARGAVHGGQQEIHARQLAIGIPDQRALHLLVVEPCISTGVAALAERSTRVIGQRVILTKIVGVQDFVHHLATFTAEHLVLVDPQAVVDAQVVAMKTVQVGVSHRAARRDCSCVFHISAPKLRFLAFLGI